MPLYEYKCSKCNHIFEQTLKISDYLKPIKQKCPSCSKKGAIDFHYSKSAAIIDPIAHQKPSKGFREVLDKVRKAHPKHNMPDRW